MLLSPDHYKAVGEAEVPYSRSAHTEVLSPSSLEGMRVREFAASRPLYLENQDADVVYGIKSGLVKVISYLPNGRARIVRLHAGGSLVGLNSLFEPRYKHTAVAVGKVVAECIPVHSLMRLRDEDPFSYCRLLESWYGQLRDADTWITQFSTGSIRARVARLVNFLSEIEHGKPSKEVKLLTCEEMAAVLGVTTESVSRILAEFKRGRMLRCIQSSSIHRFERDVEALRVAAQD